MEMSRLTRAGNNAEPFSQDRILRHGRRGQGNIHMSCSADTASRIGNLITRLIHTLTICVIIHTYMAHIKWAMVTCQGSTRSELP